MKRILPLLALLALPAAAANDGHAVYRPGLTQARIPFPSAMGYPTAYDGVPILASNLLANAEEEWLDRTLDVFKDGEHSNNATNPVSGEVWPWLIEHNHGVFAYEGELFVEEGVEYSFYGRADNGEALVVDGETVVWQGKSNGWQYGPEIHRRWTAPKTGWVPFNGWLWSWNGSYGTQWSTWSLQYNLQGVVVTFLDPSDRLSDRSESLNSWLEANRGLTNVWQRFADPGDGSFLRTVTGERFTTVESSTAAASGRSFSLSFANVPTNAQLVAFSGPADGFHDTNGWAAASAVLADVAPGTSTTNIVVPLAADARVLRFRLSHFDAASTNGLDVFEEWTEMIAVTEEPVVRVDAVSPGYTNVVVSGVLSSFGIGGTGAVVTVEVARADDAAFVAPFVTTNLPAFSTVGPFTVEFFGLSTNTAYRARAKASNGEHGGFSEPVPFRTREPGPASVSVEAAVCALFSADLEAIVSDWGGGSWNATAWIDVSADDSFPAGSTQTLGPFALSGSTPVSATATAPELEMAHAYFARARAVNSWGVGSVSETIPFSTDNQAIRFPENATVVAAKGKVSASLAPTFVTPGTVYDVSLAMEVNGKALESRSWANQTGYGPFEHTQYTSAGTEVVFVYTIAWTYGTMSGTVEVRGRATAKLADRTIHGLHAIETLRPYLRPGDALEIIPSTGTRVDWHTNAVLRITPTNSVFLLEALEPGATLLYESGADGTPNGVTGQTIVLPAEDPPGGLYIHRGFADWTWTDPAAWEMVVEGPQGYPNAIGAVAYVVEPQITDAKSHDIEVTEPVTVGSLFIGQLGWIHHTDGIKTEFFTSLVDTAGAGGSIRFETGDGSVSKIGLLGHCWVTSPIKFQLPVFAANDLDADELFRYPDSTGWKEWRDHGLKFTAPLDLGPYTFRTYRGRYYPGRNTESHERGFVTFDDDIRGSGTIRLEADTEVGMNNGSDAHRLKSFTGVWDVANGQFGKNGFSYGGAGFNFVRGSLGNASELIVRGNWHMADLSWNAGAVMRSGNSIGAWTNDWNDAIPPKVTLDGGWLRLESPGGTMNAAATAAYNETGIRRAWFRMRDFIVPAGPQGRFEAMLHGNTTSHPHTVVEITNLLVDAGAVLSVTLDTVNGAVTNEVFVMEDPDGAFDDGDVQFLPFLFANHEANDNNQLVFRNPVTKKLERRAADATEGSTDNYRRWTKAETLADGTSFKSMQVAPNVTVSFANGATVSNLTGYLDLRDGAAFGRPGEDAGVTLDFGDRPVRIYVGKRADAATVGCKLAGSSGLVKGGSGILNLGAAATAVEGAVRIAGGTLALGAADGGGTVHPARVADNIFVEAGSRLVVRNENAFGSGVRLFLRDRNWIPSVAHVRLEKNAEIARLFVNGEPMPNGYYGSSESPADTVDDVHFEGPGVLWAGIRPTMMILK